MLVNCCSVEDEVAVSSNYVIVKEITAPAIELVVVSLIVVKNDSGSVITTI